MNLKRFSSVIVLSSALALVPASGATAATVSQDSGKAAGKAARDYWTPKRMRAAELLTVDRAAAPSQLSSPGLNALAQPSDTTGPARISPATSRPGTPPVGRGAGRIVAPDFLSGQVPPEAMTTYPYSANGRIFGSFGRAGNYSCSGTVVASGSRSVVLTAGHCLHDRNYGWAKRIVFVPAYLNGAAPFGTWSVGRKVVTRGWFRTENFHGDYGAVKLSGPNGIIGDVVGQEGVTWSLPREQIFQAIGYPQNRGETELMWNCISASAGEDPLDRTRGAPDTGIGCDMGGGSSGGGWTVRDQLGNTFVNGVTSYGYKRLRNILFSPYFNGKVIQIVNQADAG